MSAELYQEYNDAIGQVMKARALYDAACVADGAESDAARQAHELFEQAVERRDQIRVTYDASARTRGPADRSGVSSQIPS